MTCQAKRPVIVCCPAKNEAELLARTVPAWLTFADHVIVADQASTDHTLSVLSQFERVTCIDNPEEDYNEGTRNVLLVTAARKIDSSAVLLFLDADETLSANVLSSPEWRHFCDLPPGTAGAFSWVSLWKSANRYIARGTGSPATQGFAFIDDGREVKQLGTMHKPRGVGLDDAQTIFVFSEVVTLHLGTAFFQKLRRRQNWYKVWWRNRGGRFYHTNRNHNWIYNVRDSDLADSPPQWFEAFSRLGLDVTSIEEKDLWWYDIDILRWFAAHGESKYHLIDIWDEPNWEAIRLKALKRGISGLPDQPIRGPGAVIRIFHRWTAGRVTLQQATRAGRRWVVRMAFP